MRHRRSMRLRGYDYAAEGAYFITICTHQRKQVLGAVIDGTAQLSAMGIVVQEEWLKTPTIRPEVELDDFVVMPNHIHGIVILRARGIDDHIVGANCDSPLQTSGFRSPSGNIGAIVRGFKGATTKRIDEIQKTPRAPLWQRGFYDHVVRDAEDLNRIRDYIVNNPGRWWYDHENPDRITHE